MTGDTADPDNCVWIELPIMDRSFDVGEARTRVTIGTFKGYYSEDFGE